jgi:chorismate mutase
MTNEITGDLADLRAEIDRIDSAIAALLAERQAVSARIGAAKGAGSPIIRPGREARVLRRLIAEVADKVEPVAVLRLWREIFAASTRAQAPLAVAVCAPTGERPLWELARNHFGGATPFLRVERPAQGLRAVLDDSAQAAVLPPPDDDVLWWVGLIESRPRLQVVAKLPFGVVPSSREVEEARGYVVGQLRPEPSDDDISLLALNAPVGLSRGRLRELLAEAGFAASWLGVTRPPASHEAWHLIEVDGFVADDDARLADLPRDYPREVERCVRIGAYARPYTLPDG